MNIAKLSDRKLLEHIAKGLKLFREANLVKEFEKQNEIVARSVPTNWVPYEVAPCPDQSDECECKKGNNGNQLSRTCTLSIDTDTNGAPYISPDDPHFFIKKKHKRQLVWQIDKNADPKWQFREYKTSTQTFTPITVFAESQDQLPDTFPGRREMVYKIDAKKRTLTLCYDPKEGTTKRTFWYKIFMYDGSAASALKPLELDPIIEYEDGF